MNTKQPIRTNQHPRNKVLVGDVRTELQALPEAFIDCVVTSPPYFRLRNYQRSGQLGLEGHIDDWVTNIVAVFDDLTRVLTPQATVWLNVGDSYSRHRRVGAKEKSMVLAPERLIVALAKRGWITRNKLVWAKTNPMPSSVKDRLSCTWEPIYFLTRSAQYYFDLDAIRVPHRSHGPTASNKRRNRTPRVVPEWQGPLAGTNDGLDALRVEGRAGHPLGKNPGDVWQIATSSFRGAHFATFPEALVEQPIKAGCPERVCVDCNTPWRRQLPRTLGHLAVMGELEANCQCNSPWRTGVVLDPFMGSGTTAAVATKLHRDWLGIDINDEFADLTTSRVKRVEATQKPAQPHRGKARAA